MSTQNRLFVYHVCLVVSLGFIQGVWIGSALYLVIMGSSCIIGRPSLISVCWVSFDWGVVAGSE